MTHESCFMGSLFLITSDFLGNILQGNILLITIYFQEQWFLNTLWNLIISGNSRHAILKSGWPEETVSWTPELILSSGPVIHSEVNVDSVVDSIFAKTKYWLHKCHFSADIPIGDPVFIELTGYFKSDWGQFDDVLRLKKIIYGQAKATRLW